MVEKLKIDGLATLEESIGFDDVELAANAYGLLSPRQHKNLNQKRKDWFLLFTSLSVLYGLLVIEGVKQFVERSERYPLNSLLIPSILGVFGAKIIFMMYTKWNGYLQALDSPVERIEGRVSLGLEERNKTPHYFLAMGETEFQIDKEIFLAFKNGDPYRIYYAPGSNTILSAEWLRGE